MAITGFSRGPGSHATTRSSDPAVDERDREHEQRGRTEQPDEQTRRRIPVGHDAAEPVSGREACEHDPDQRAPDVEGVAEERRQHAARRDLEPEQHAAGDEDGDTDRERAALTRESSRGARGQGRRRRLRAPARSSCSWVTSPTSAIASLPAGRSESRSSTCSSGSSTSRAASTNNSGSSRSSASSSSSSRRHLDDDLDRVAQLDVLVAGAHDACVARRTGRGQDRQAGRSANRVERGRRRGAPPPRRPRPARASSGTRHGDDQRDPVTLGDGLAQTSGAGHATATLPIVATFQRVRVRVAIVLLLAALPSRRAGGRAPADPRDRPRGLPARAERAPTGSSRERGDDRISAEYDGGIDRISCGPGRDVVTADARDRVDSDCEVVSTRIHRDRQTNADSQHESQVEPDSFTVGTTTVALFQNGRNRTGGAASIAFSTSKDGGRTWREGILPGLTLTSAPPGTATRASDPTARLRQRARRLAGEHARDRARLDAAHDPPLPRRPGVDRADRRGSRARRRHRVRQELARRATTARPALFAAAATSRTRWSASRRARTTWRCSIRATAASPGRRRQRFASQ